MKAALVRAYDKHNIKVDLTDVPDPTAKPGEVLIAVRTAGVNPLDNMISRGEVKMITPYALPLIAGNEVVGEIAALGEGVTGFSVGQRVFARLPLDQIGAFAEYVAVDAQALALVPDYLSDEEAAGVPLTALTAMQALDLLAPQPGERIFISGGSGGFGAMAIPLAKARGLYVITTGNAESEGRIRGLGADEYIDFRSQNYLELVHDVDYVIDTLGGDALKEQFRILKSGGSLVSLRGMPNKAFAQSMGLPLWKQWLFGLAGRSLDSLAKRNNQTYHFIFVQANGQQLAEIAQLFEAQQLRPSIDTVYAFDQLNVALEKVASGKSVGKTVVRIQGASS